MAADTAAMGAEDADGVGLVDYEEGAENFGQAMILCQWSDVAVHAENGIDDDETTPRPLPVFLKQSP